MILHVLYLPTKFAVSGNNHYGTLKHKPAGAVTGMTGLLARTIGCGLPMAMVATHSHDDDLDDAKWDTSFSSKFRLARLHHTFFLRPDVSIEKPPSVAQKVSNFTYMGKPPHVNERSYLYSSLAAYANEHLYDEAGEILSAAGEVKQDGYFHTLEKLATPRLSDQVS